MKKFTFAAIAAVAAIMISSCGNGTPKANLKSDIDTVSYAIGMAQTQGLKDYLVGRLGVLLVSRLVSRFLVRWLRASTTSCLVMTLPRLSL